MWTFLAVWFGQLISLVGSAMTSFGLGIWVYQRTGSASEVALISVAASLPGILLSPLAGVFADRYDRRAIMILSDSCAGLTTLTLALLFAAGQLETFHIYIGAMIASTANAFQYPAYVATTTLMVPKQHHGRAAGLVYAADGLSSMFAPAIAGVLIAIIGLQGIMLIDFSTFLFAISMLLVVRFPKPLADTGAEKSRASVWGDIVFGWRYVVVRRGLFALILYFTALNFTFGFVFVLLTPMLLGFTTTESLGMVVSAGGLGMIIGSVLMGAWGGPRRRLLLILGFGVLQAVTLFITGWSMNLVWIAAAQFMLYAGSPFVNGALRALMQSKVDPHIQGRVFSVMRMLAWASLPLAYVLAGPLADIEFEPAMQPGGFLAASMGPLIGTGPGRGMALMYLLAGWLTLMITLVAFLYGPLRRVEREVPDYDAKAPTAAVQFQN